MTKDKMKIWEIPIYGTHGEVCVSVTAKNANTACQIAWRKLNDDFDDEYIDFWGNELDWDYTIYKYPHEVLNIWNMTLFYSPPTAEAFGWKNSL